MGPDMVSSRRRMGMTPILFSWGGWTGRLTAPPLPGRLGGVLEDLHGEVHP